MNNHKSITLIKTYKGVRYFGNNSEQKKVSNTLKIGNNIQLPLKYYFIGFFTIFGEDFG
ncbi:hypothetical protein KORDIASMS9_00217 [Kordia sp. SMS9]|nr:hypothetical protein KORDIASMS9_00217 [Kordia sp. SMS9]